MFDHGLPYSELPWGILVSPIYIHVYWRSPANPLLLIFGTQQPNDLSKWLVNFSIQIDMIHQHVTATICSFNSSLPTVVLTIKSMDWSKGQPAGNRQTSLEKLHKLWITMGLSGSNFPFPVLYLVQRKNTHVPTQLPKRFTIISKPNRSLTTRPGSHG